MPTLTYGSKVTNAYIQIAQILRRATERPPPRAPAITPPAEQRVPATEPRVATREPRVEDTNRPRPTINAPLPQPIVSPQPSVQKSTPRVSQPAKEVRPAIRKSPRLPRLHAQRRYVTRYGRAIDNIQRAQHAEAYKHHIAALATPIDTTKGNQGSIKKLLKGPDAKIWDRGRANEWGHLLEHGVGLQRPASERIEGSGTLFFVRRANIPADRKVSYANMVCDIRPQKAETHRVRITAGGDRLEYPHDPSSPAVSMLNTKIHINSTISDANKGA